MNIIQKIKIRTFGPQTFRKRSHLWVGTLVFGATLSFVAVASGSFGLTPNFLGMLVPQKTGTQQVEGISVSQLPGNCPSAGLIVTPPSDAIPFPLPTTINPQTPPPTLSSGKYFVNGTLTINGNLNINGAVEIYADNISVASTATINANGTGNAGGAGGIATHRYDYPSGANFSRTVVTAAGDGVGYCTNGAPGCDFTTNPQGGGASKSSYVAPDGAGGGGHGGRGGGGSNHSGQPGGAANFNGNPNDYAIRMGSGGGGGYCEKGGNKCNGGNGGGSISFYATNFTSQGNILANGNAAPNIGHVADTCKFLPVPGSCNGWQQAGGGGGAGGGILISAINMTVGGTLQAKGGNGATTCTNCTDDDDAGGGGGGGEIKLFHDPNGTTYAVTAAVDVSGGDHGDQTKPNLPESGDGGFTTNGSCPGTVVSQCSTWNFALNDYGVVPVPGQKIVIGASTQNAGFKNHTVSITHELDANEVTSLGNVGIVYGDWEGVKFNATKDHYYKACYSLRAGPDNSVMPWSDPNAFTETRFYNDATGGTSEYPIGTKIKPAQSSTFQALTKSFQATWPGTQTTSDSYIQFRTGSSIGQWFTGQLDIDNVGVFDCGANQANCQNVSCNISSPSNLIANPVQNGQFENPAGFDSSVWIHATAAPTGKVPSVATRATENIQGVTNGFMRLQSNNFFTQGVTQCGAHCYTWQETQSVENADLQLYAVGTVSNALQCNVPLQNIAHGTLQDCPNHDANLTTDGASCSGQVLPQANIDGPIEVCQGDKVDLSGTVSSPRESVLGDLHTYRWSTSGGNPTIPHLQSDSPQTDSGSSDITATIDNAGNNDFTVNLDVTSKKGMTPAHAETSVHIVDCSPGTPGTYDQAPSEDIHASGRAAINPPPGTTNPQKKVLDWREIIGNLLY